MEMPGVQTVMMYRGVRYEVLAYRTMSREEMIYAVGLYLSGKKKQKKGSVVQIVSVIGANDPM